MSNPTRDAILERLNAMPKSSDHAPSDFSIMSDLARRLNEGDKIAQYRRVTEAVNTEVHAVTPETLYAHMEKTLAQKQVKTVIYGANTDIAAEVSSMGLATIAYDDAYEALKQTIFEIDASVTTSLGGIAQTGSVVLWPTLNEPRLLSLVPPIHVVVLHEDQMFGTFHEMMTTQGWQGHLPTNALLISGPSKTADIEQELCYGVHGPKELIVYIVQSVPIHSIPVHSVTAHSATVKSQGL